VKINTRVRYAVRMMADIAAHSAKGPVPLREVSERQGISRLYLSQLAAPLRNSGLLRSVWGNKGGYLPTRPPSEITLLEIIEAVDGPVAVLDCVVDAGFCDRAPECAPLSVWRDINAAIIRILEQYTLEDLVHPSKAGNPAQALCVQPKIVGA